METPGHIAFVFVFIDTSNREGTVLDSLWHQPEDIEMIIVAVERTDNIIAMLRQLEEDPNTNLSWIVRILTFAYIHTIVVDPVKKNLIIFKK